MQFRGREMSKPELGLKLLRRFTADLGEQGSAEGSAGDGRQPDAPDLRPGKKSVKKTTDCAGSARRREEGDEASAGSGRSGRSRRCQYQERDGTRAGSSGDP